MAVVHTCFPSARQPIPNAGSSERTAVRGHSELVWECLALWCSAWLASFLGRARCHRISGARWGTAMLAPAGRPWARASLAPPAPRWPPHPRSPVIILPSPPRTPHLSVILPAPRLHHRECCSLCRWVGKRLPDGGSAQLEDLDGEVIDDRTLKFWEMRVEEHLFGASPSGAAAPGKAPYALKHARASSILGAKCCVDKRAH